MSNRPFSVPSWRTLDDFPVSRRLYNILYRYEQTLELARLTAGQLRNTDDATLRARYGMGPVMLAELRRMLAMRIRKPYERRR